MKPVGAARASMLSLLAIASPCPMRYSSAGSLTGSDGSITV